MRPAGDELYFNRVLFSQIGRRRRLVIGTRARGAGRDADARAGGGRDDGARGRRRGRARCGRSRDDRSETVDDDGG